MKTSSIIGKMLHTDALSAALAIFLPNDYDQPCYRIIVTTDGYCPAERCSYYADVLVDDNTRSLKVERYKDNYMVNSPIRSFPPALELVLEAMLRKATE